MSPIKKKRERDNKCVRTSAMVVGSCECNPGESTVKSSSVQFSQDVIVRPIPSHQDLEAREWNLLWYTPEDYISFTDQCEVSAQKLDEKDLRFHSKRRGSSYGLESWTKDGFRKSLKNRKDSVHVVLEEQYAQWDDGQQDGESIAELYSARCQHVKMVALTRGLMLEREVQKLQAKAMLESPRLFSSLNLKQLSPYIEKMRLILTRSQFSSSYDDDLFVSEAYKQGPQSPKSDDDSTAIVDCENFHPPKHSFSPRLVVPPFSPRPSSETKTKKRKS